MGEDKNAFRDNRGCTIYFAEPIAKKIHALVFDDANLPWKNLKVKMVSFVYLL